MTSTTDSMYFMHYRRRDSYGTPFSQGGATLAIRPLGGNVIRVAMARCSEKDIFNKKLGRTIAEGRLDAKPGSLSDKYVFDIVSPAPDMPVKEAVHMVMGPVLIEDGLE